MQSLYSQEHGFHQGNDAPDKGVLAGAAGVERAEAFAVVLYSAILTANGEAEVIPAPDHHSLDYSLPAVGEPGLFSQRIPFDSLRFYD